MAPKPEETFRKAETHSEREEEILGEKQIQMDESIKKASNLKRGNLSESKR